jgi:hypothetical protein
MRQMTGTIGDGADLAARAASAGICRRTVWQDVRWVSVLPQDLWHKFDHGARGEPQHVRFDVPLPILVSPHFAFSDLSSGEDTLLCMFAQIRSQRKRRVPVSGEDTLFRTRSLMHRPLSLASQKPGS